jgi:hypothetical protein
MSFDFVNSIFQHHCETRNIAVLRELIEFGQDRSHWKLLQAIERQFSIDNDFEDAFESLQLLIDACLVDAEQHEQQLPNETQLLQSLPKEFPFDLIDLVKTNDLNLYQVALEVFRKTQDSYDFAHTLEQINALSSDNQYKSMKLLEIERKQYENGDLSFLMKSKIEKGHICVYFFYFL